MSADGPRPRGRVLVLEDDAGIRRLERIQLERAGYEVVVTATIDEARTALETGGIDLLLLDYQLSAGENGLGFYCALQELGSVPPAILVTGFSDERRMLEAMRAGVRDFILKSDSFIDLVVPTVERVMVQVTQARRLREAEEASRAKDEFLATLSHELRTPLTPVLALLSALRHDSRLPADVLADIGMIHRNIGLEARLIDDLLDLTRIAHGKLELRMAALDLVPLVRHAIGSICAHDAGEKSITFQAQLPSHPLWVHGDEARLTQIVWNLLKNAIKFSQPGSEVRVEASQIDDWTEIRVIDHGIGIESSLLPHIFGAFEQGGREVTRRFGGLGLGLAISKAITDLHGGTISAQSEGPGHGATFTVRLPTGRAYSTTSSSSEAGAPLGQGSRQSSAHLLLVEDHHDTASVMARILRRAGYRVTTARTVAEALTALENAHATIDSSGRAETIHLVLSDMGLPDGSGHEVMRFARDRYSCQGIALSGYGMDEDIRASREAGFARHLTKPVAMEDLVSTIRELLGSTS